VPWGGTQGCTGSAGQPRAQPFPSSSPQSYSVGLYLVRQMTSAELLQRLKTIGIKHPELCKALGEYFWAGGAGGGSLYAHLVGIPGSQAARNVCES